MAGEGSGPEVLVAKASGTAGPQRFPRGAGASKWWVVLVAWGLLPARLPNGGLRAMTLSKGNKVRSCGGLRRSIGAGPCRLTESHRAPLPLGAATRYSLGAAPNTKER